MLVISPLLPLSKCFPKKNLKSEIKESDQAIVSIITLAGLE